MTEPPAQGQGTASDQPEPALGQGEGSSDAIDLDAQPVPPPPTTASGPPSPPPGSFERPFDPNPARESVRGLIAQWLVLLLAGIVTAAFWFAAWRPDARDSLKDLLQVVLGPVVALVGSATGYYFGSERAAAATQQTPAPATQGGSNGSVS